MKSLICILVILSGLIPCLASASPQGIWPDDMRGFNLPKQDWIMIIPATRGPDGAISVWNRSDPWNREWVVPKTTPLGTRTIAVNGDSEDMRIVSADQIDNMSVSSLSRLAGKYGASAIAVVVFEQVGGTAVAAWAKGNYATWEAVVPAEGQTQRQAALVTLDDIFSGEANVPAYEVAAAASEGQMSARILGQRFNETLSLMEYRVEGSFGTLKRLIPSPDVEITGQNFGDIFDDTTIGYMDMAISKDGNIEDILISVGINAQ
jgi:hypothetical protein